LKYDDDICISKSSIIAYMLCSAVSSTRNYLKNFMKEIYLCHTYLRKTYLCNGHTMVYYISYQIYILYSNDKLEEYS
jgi:hypothetical protein